MAKSSEKKYRYEPIERLKRTPSHTWLNGKLVALGGESFIRRQAPKKDLIIPEATQEEYKTLRERGGGMEKAIKRIEIKEENDKSPESTSTKSKGR